MNESITNNNNNTTVTKYDGGVNTSTNTIDSTQTNDLTSTQINDTTEKTTYGKTNTITKTGSETTATNETESGVENYEHSLTRHGNIGVTTSQQMIDAERKIRDFSAVAVYLKDIANVICLQVY